MTRTDTIRTPGKFEGEPAYVAYLWKRCAGQADELLWDGAYLYDVFDLSDPTTARIVRPSSDDAFLLLWERGDGFVNSSLLTAAEYSAFVAECDAVADEEY